MASRPSSPQSDYGSVTPPSSGCAVLKNYAYVSCCLKRRNDEKTADFEYRAKRVKGYIDSIKKLRKRFEFEFEIEIPEIHTEQSDEHGLVTLNLGDFDIAFDKSKDRTQSATKLRAFLKQLKDLGCTIPVEGDNGPWQVIEGSVLLILRVPSSEIDRLLELVGTDFGGGRGTLVGVHPVVRVRLGPAGGWQHGKAYKIPAPGGRGELLVAVPPTPGFWEGSGHDPDKRLIGQM